MNPTVLLIVMGGLMFLVIGGLSMLSHYYTLSGIKSKTVGDGQHGTARFATDKEVREAYLHIPFTPAQWRAGKNMPPVEHQGLIVGSKVSGSSTVALVDTGDVHTLMVGAAGIGKTAYFVYPNLEYACATGMSWLCTDTKGVRPDRVL